MSSTAQCTLPRRSRLLRCIDISGDGLKVVAKGLEGEDSPPVPGCGIQHIRGNDASPDTCYIVRIASQDSRLVSQPGRWSFWHDDIGQRADAAIVDKCIHEQHSPDPPRNAGAACRPKGDEAHDHERDECTSKTCEEDGASAEALDHGPGEQCADECECIQSETHVEGLRCAHPGLLEKDDGVRLEHWTAHLLRDPGAHGYFCPAEIGALETLCIARSFGKTSLDCVGMSQ